MNRSACRREVGGVGVAAGAGTGVRWRQGPTALLWAAVVFGVYTVMVLAIGPFNDWSASDQLQFFQGMVGLAGFGAGGVALFFAAQQISHLYARPLLKVRFTAFDPSGKLYLRAEPVGDPLRIVTTAATSLRLDVEVTNLGATICPEWRVDILTLIPVANVELSSGDWRQVTPRHVSRQAGEGEALYPDSPLPIGFIYLDFEGINRPGEIRLGARTITERGWNVRDLTIQLIEEPPSEG